jgi:DNA mismatch endonuclease (patch repair protein)
MADVFTKSKRSQVMAAIRGKGNRTTEWRLRSRLIQAGIRGWRVGSTEVLGKPDFSFGKRRLAVFVDGCFWHGCKRCRNIPAHNHSFWLRKIRSNRDRDARVTRSLRNKGWRVARIWEHQVRRDPEKCITFINVLLNSRRK